MNRVWFVTGATRGIGSEIAQAALAAGSKVVATGRKADAVGKALGASENLLASALDVTDEDQIKSAVNAAVEHFGRIDVLVNNAGYGQLGIFEETSPQQIRAQYDTNVFGLMAMTRAVLPIMRKQQSGRIFNISSIAGLKGFPGRLHLQLQQIRGRGILTVDCRRSRPTGNLCDRYFAWILSYRLPRRQFRAVRSKHNQRLR